MLYQSFHTGILKSKLSHNHQFGDALLKPISMLFCPSTSLTIIKINLDDIPRTLLQWNAPTGMKYQI